MVEKPGKAWAARFRFGVELAEVTVTRVTAKMAYVSDGGAAVGRSSRVRKESLYPTRKEAWESIRERVQIAITNARKKADEYEAITRREDGPDAD